MFLVNYRNLFTLLPIVSIDFIFIHRRSIAERGDVFSGVCLFASVSVCVCVRVCVCVCLSVCQFVRMITSERLKAGRSNLTVRYIVQKSHQSSKVKVKVQGHQGQKTKNC